MSGQGMHITGYLGAEDHGAVFRFIEAAARLASFREIIPVRRHDGRIIAVAFMTDGGSNRRMPDLGVALGGILSRDILIASAWEAEQGQGGKLAWLVPGGHSGAVRGEVVREMPELNAAED